MGNKEGNKGKLTPKICKVLPRYAELKAKINYQEESQRDSKKNSHNRSRSYGLKTFTIIAIYIIIKLLCHVL